MKRRELYNKTFCGVTGGVICGSAALSQSSCVPKSGHFGASTESIRRRRRKRNYTATKKRHQKLFAQFICIKHFKVEVIRLVLQKEEKAYQEIMTINK
jgi:hypothetical protein